MIQVQVRDEGSPYDGQRGIIVLVRSTLVIVALDSGEVRAFPELKVLADEAYWQDEPTREQFDDEPEVRQGPGF